MYEENLRFKYLQPIRIDNKEYYYKLIYEVSDALTSRLIGDDFLHTANINLLIEELGQLLANSIELYEWGYFDNAYYSLRSANELATIILDLSDKEDWAIKKNMESFLEKRYHKKRYKILEWLSKEGIIFKEVLDKMPNFKNEINTLMDEINQVIHMSGRENLYTFRQNFGGNDFHKYKLKQFENHFLSSIKILAIFRLIIDPFPLLLVDDEISHRCPDIMTFPFNKDLLDVIGEKTILEFEQTESFLSIKNEILKMERRKTAVNDFITINLLDLDKIDDIYSQKHLLNESQLKFLEIASCSRKIVTMKTGNGIYWCNTTSNTKFYTCNILSDDYLNNINTFFNNTYGDIYVSIINSKEYINLDYEFKSNLIYIFHENKLDDEEIDKLKQTVKKFDMRENGT